MPLYRPSRSCADNARGALKTQHRCLTDRCSGSRLHGIHSANHDMRFHSCGGRTPVQRSRDVVVAGGVNAVPAGEAPEVDDAVTETSCKHGRYPRRALVVGDDPGDAARHYPSTHGDQITLEVRILGVVRPKRDDRMLDRHMAGKRANGFTGRCTHSRMNRAPCAAGGKRCRSANADAVAHDQANRHHARPAICCTAISDMAKIDSQITIWP